MDDLKEFLCFMACGATAIAGTILIVVFGVSTISYYTVTKPACEQYGRLTGAEISTQYAGAGCLVKYEGRWVDYDVAVKAKQEIKVMK